MQASKNQAPIATQSIPLIAVPGALPAGSANNSPHASARILCIRDLGNAAEFPLLRAGRLILRPATVETLKSGDLVILADTAYEDPETAPRDLCRAEVEKVGGSIQVSVIFPNTPKGPYEKIPMDPGELLSAGDELQIEAVVSGIEFDAHGPRLVDAPFDPGPYVAALREAGIEVTAIERRSAHHLAWSVVNSTDHDLFEIEDRFAAAKVADPDWRIRVYEHLRSLGQRCADGVQN